MTLPKTHPLYGAVEALALTYGANTPLESKRPWVREHFTKKAMDHIRALESAGYRVVGPESIPDIAEAAGNHAWTTYKHKGQWEWAKLMRIAVSAAPTITEKEKGND